MDGIVYGGCLMRLHGANHIVTASLRLLSSAADQSRIKASAMAPARPRTRPNWIRNEWRLDHTSCMALVIGSFGRAWNERKRALGGRLWSLGPEIVQARLLGDRIRLDAALCGIARAGPQDKCKNPQTQQDQRTLPDKLLRSRNSSLPKSISFLSRTIVDPFAPSASRTVHPSVNGLPHQARWANRHMEARRSGISTYRNPISDSARGRPSSRPSVAQPALMRRLCAAQRSRLDFL